MGLAPLLTALARIVTDLLRASRSQLLLRVVGLAASLMLIVAVPVGDVLGGLAIVCLVAAALLAVVRPDPLGGPAVLLALGIYLCLAPSVVTGPRPVIAAALALAQLTCLVIGGSAPPGADVDRTVVRTYLRRWGAMVAVAAAVWLLSMGATALPGVGAYLPALVAVLALLGVVGAALVVLRQDDET